MIIYIAVYYFYLYIAVYYFFGRIFINNIIKKTIIKYKSKMEKPSPFKKIERQIKAYSQDICPNKPNKQYCIFENMVEPNKRSKSKQNKQSDRFIPL